MTADKWTNYTTARAQQMSAPLIYGDDGFTIDEREFNSKSPEDVTCALNKLFEQVFTLKRKNGTTRLHEDMNAKFSTWDSRPDSLITLSMNVGRRGSPATNKDVQAMEELATQFVKDLIRSYHNAADGSDIDPIVEKSGNGSWKIKTGLTSVQLANAVVDRLHQTRRINSTGSQERGGRG